MYYFKILVLLLVLTPKVYSSEQLPSHANTVKLFVAAFNAQDSGAMATLVTDNIEWFSIESSQVSVEAKGRSNLIESMDAYFKSCPTCRSEVTKMLSTTNRVSAVEIASWQTKNGLSSQRAISVYEFSNGLINRVYYFPAEK